MLCYGVEGV
jgi:hypothetical protein